MKSEESAPTTPSPRASGRTRIPNVTTSLPTDIKRKTQRNYIHHCANAKRTASRDERRRRPPVRRVAYKTERTFRS